MSRLVALVRTDVSEDLISSFIRVIRYGDLRTVITVINRSTLRRNTVWKRKRWNEMKNEGGGKGGCKQVAGVCSVDELEDGC
jgi:hypothetical protein